MARVKQPKKENNDVVGFAPTRFEELFISEGLWPEELIFEVLGISRDYLRQWAKERDIPLKSVKGRRWIHRDNLAEWMKAAKEDPPEVEAE